jgi:muramoyltetrapeptide carboxypeptidase
MSSARRLKLKRRNFLSSIAAGCALPLIGNAVLSSNQSQSRQSASELIHPKVLRRGDTVGLITPGTYVSDPERLSLIEPTMKFFGLRAQMGKNAGKRLGTYRSSIDERLDDLHNMFRDKEVQAVVCIRGGYGASQLLDRIDYDLIRRNPKIFLGYSDITALHLAIHRYSKLVTFHGPMIVSDFSDYTQKHFTKALFETTPIGKVTNPGDQTSLRPSHPLRTIRPGTASGQLVGGNLTLIATTLGTPYEIETRGRILFLEDVDEQPYSLDRMLTQLRLAGKFDHVAGVIFGECADCRPRDYKPSLASPFSAGEVVDNILGGLKVPVLSGMTIGHTADQLTLPLGVMATLDATAGTLDIKEAGVS